MNVFQRLNITVLKCARSFDGYTILKTDRMQHRGIEFICPQNCTFWIAVANNVYDEFQAIRSRDVVLSFFLSLP